MFAQHLQLQLTPAPVFLAFVQHGLRGQKRADAPVFHCHVRNVEPCARSVSVPALCSDHIGVQRCGIVAASQGFCSAQKVSGCRILVPGDLFDQLNGTIRMVEMIRLNRCFCKERQHVFQHGPRLMLERAKTGFDVFVQHLNVPDDDRLKRAPERLIRPIGVKKGGGLEGINRLAVHQFRGMGQSDMSTVLAGRLRQNFIEHGNRLVHQHMGKIKLAQIQKHAFFLGTMRRAKKDDVFLVVAVKCAGGPMTKVEGCSPRRTALFRHRRLRHHEHWLLFFFSLLFFRGGMNVEASPQQKDRGDQDQMLSFHPLILTKSFNT